MCESECRARIRKVIATSAAKNLSKTIEVDIKELGVFDEVLRRVKCCAISYPGLSYRISSKYEYSNKNFISSRTRRITQPLP